MYGNSIGHFIEDTSENDQLGLVKGVKYILSINLKSVLKVGHNIQ